LDVTKIHSGQLKLEKTTFICQTWSGKCLKKFKCGPLLIKLIIEGIIGYCCKMLTEPHRGSYGKSTAMLLNILLMLIGDHQSEQLEEGVKVKITDFVSATRDKFP